MSETLGVPGEKIYMTMCSNCESYTAISIWSGYCDKDEDKRISNMHSCKDFNLKEELNENK